MTESSGRRSPAWVIVALGLLAVILPRIFTLYEPYTFLIGDCPYYAQTAVSLVLDHDLDLRNQLRGGLGVHARQVSLGARGEWYPKHPLLMPALSAPLLPLLGTKGFLVFNVAVLVGLGLALYELCTLAASRTASALGALGTILGSFLILYDYNFSADLLACLLLTLAVIAVIRQRPLAGGLLAGLAVFARTSNIFLLPLFLLYTAWRGKEERRRMIRSLLVFGAMAVLPLLVQALLNASMFGSPLVSPYMRIMDLQDGQVVLRSHMSDFDNPLWEGVKGQLLHREKGLLYSAPILMLALPGLLIWLRRRPDQALLCLALGEFIFLLFSRYRWWQTSHVGNRFLMPTAALSAPALACLVDWILAEGARLRGNRRKEAGPGGDAPASGTVSPRSRTLKPSSLVIPKGLPWGGAGQRPGSPSRGSVERVLGEPIRRGREFGIIEVAVLAARYHASSLMGSRSARGDSEGPRRPAPRPPHRPPAPRAEAPRVARHRRP